MDLTLSPRRHKWWRWAAAAVALACLAVVILAVTASRYQPVSYGSMSSSVEWFPSLPAGHGIRPVNNMGGSHEDMYIPPQRGIFSLFADITNTGTHPVTIVSARLPEGTALALARPVRYSLPGMGGSNQMPPPVSRVLHDVVLQPGHEMFLGFPTHMWPCTKNEGWQGIPDFYVTVRYSIFSHTVAVPWGMQGDSLLVRAPGGRPGQKGVTCAPGTTRANLPKVPAQDSGPHLVGGAIVRIHKGRDVGELRLTEMTAPDAAPDGPLPPCFLQYPPGPARPPAYRVVNFDLNWAGINFGQDGTAPAVRVTIAGPDGVPVVAAVPKGPAGDGIACRTVRSFSLGREAKEWQLVYGLTLRVPEAGAIDHLLVTADGHTITVPLVPACNSRSASAACFPGDELGGPWTSGTPYSDALRT